MVKIIPDEQFILKNYDQVSKLCMKFKGLSDLIEDFGERYAICPASSKKEYYSCFPGGLIYHSLQTLLWISKFSSIMAEGQLTKETMIKLAILHEIGKLGTKEEEYYIPQNSDWHREKGIYYETNPKIQFMKIPHRSLFLAQQYSIELTQDEYLAILLANGQINDAMPGQEPNLATILRYAAQWAMKLEKENEVLWPV